MFYVAFCFSRDFLSVVTLRGLSPGTVRGYSYDLGRLHTFLSDRGIVDVTRVTPTDLRAFLGSLAVRQSTRGRYLACLRAFFRYLADEGGATPSPAGRIPTLHSPDYLPQPVDPTWVDRALTTMEGHLRDRTLFTLLAETGLRVSEALTLRLEHVSLSPASHSFVRVMGKGRRERIVPLAAAVRTRELLGHYLRGRPETGFVFPHVTKATHRDDDTAPMTYSSARMIWVIACRRAGVPRIRIHQLRHTYATQLVAHDVPILTVQKVLGHKKLDTTMRYTAVDDRAVARDLARLVDDAPRAPGPKAAPNAPVASPARVRAGRRMRPRRNRP